MFGGRKQGRRNGTVLTAITIALGYVVHVGICCTSWNVLYMLGCAVQVGMCCTNWDVLYKWGCAVHVKVDRLYLLGWAVHNDERQSQQHKHD